MHCSQKLGEDFAKVCGLLRIYELYAYLILQNNTTYILIKRQNTEEKSTVLTITGLIPKFGQNPISYIELDELTDAYLTLDITICFKATAENGLILFKKGTVIQNQ